MVLDLRATWLLLRRASACRCLCVPWAQCLVSLVSAQASRSVARAQACEPRTRSRTTARAPPLTQRGPRCAQPRADTRTPYPARTASHPPTRTHSRTPLRSPHSRVLRLRFDPRPPRPPPSSSSVGLKSESSSSSSSSSPSSPSLPAAADDGPAPARRTGEGARRGLGCNPQAWEGHRHPYVPRAHALRVLRTLRLLKAACQCTEGRHTHARIHARTHAHTRTQPYTSTRTPASPPAACSCVRAAARASATAASSADVCVRAGKRGGRGERGQVWGGVQGWWCTVGGWGAARVCR